MYCDGNGVWRADYTGDTTLETDWPVDSFFDVFTDLNVEKMGGGGSGGTTLDITNAVQTVSLLIPEGYTLLPEPGTLSLLGLGVLGLLRRKRG